jgi:hypothetical protein
MLLCGTLLLSLTKYTTVSTELRREVYNYNAFKVYQKKIIERNGSCSATAGSSYTYNKNQNNCSWLLSMISRKSI